MTLRFMHMRSPDAELMKQSDHMKISQKVMMIHRAMINKNSSSFGVVITICLVFMTNSS